jgi:mRNA degradation ribonuclease J1/J2
MQVELFVCTTVSEVPSYAGKQNPVDLVCADRNYVVQRQWLLAVLGCVSTHGHKDPLTEAAKSPHAFHKQEEEEARVHTVSALPEIDLQRIKLNC